VYIGLSVKNPDKKPGSSMGKGFLFEWGGDSGRYMELSMNAIRENVIEKEEEMAEAKTKNLSKQDKLSSEEYQKAKKSKNFDKSKYKWDEKQDLYVKVDKVDEGTGRKIKDFPFVMHWSDGVAQALGGDTYLDLINAANAKSLKSFAIYKQAPGFHSTTQENYLVAWYDEDGNGYWSNRAKKEPDLNDRKLDDNFETPSGVEEAVETEVVPTHVCIVDLKDGIDTTPLIPKGAEVAISDDLVVEDIKNGIICDIDEQELEIHFKPIGEVEAANEAAENEYHMTVSKKLFAAIYNMKPGERSKLLEEILKVPAGPIKERTKMAAEALAKQPTEYKKALKVVHPKLYKSIYEEETPKRFPMIAECNDEGEMTVNPLFEAIKNPKFKLEKVKITNEFEEDELPCINAVAYINNKRYKFSDWYLEHKTVKKYHLAEAGDRGAMQGIRNRLTRLGNEFIKEHKNLQKELKAAKINEEAATAKNEASDKIQQMFDAIKKLDDTKFGDKKKIKELEKEIEKLSKENGFSVEEIAAFEAAAGKIVESGDEWEAMWRPVTDDDHLDASAESMVNDQTSKTHLFIYDSVAEKLSIMAQNGDNTAQIDINGIGEESVYNIIHAIIDMPWDETKAELDRLIEGDHLGGQKEYTIITEAEDTEYFDVEAKLRDICFQQSQQSISNDDAVKQAQEVLKDSEELSAVFTDVAPEALIDEIINYYGWTQSDLNENSGTGTEAEVTADEVDAKFKQICADYYADLLPTADAVAQARAALDDCKDSHPELNEVCAGCDDESIMYLIASHYNWNAFELAESVKK